MLATRRGKQRLAAVLGGKEPKLYIADKFIEDDGTSVDSHTIDTVNVPSASWTIGNRTWTIETGNLVPQGASGARCYVNSGLSDVCIAVDMRVNAATPAQGILFRHSDSSNYWIAHVKGNPVDTVTLTKVVGGSSSTVVTDTISALTDDTFYRLQLVAYQDEIRFYIDGSLVLSASGQTDLQTNTNHGCFSGTTNIYNNFAIHESLSADMDIPNSGQFKYVSSSDYASNPLIGDSNNHRRDPSRVVQIDSTYYMYYTKMDSAAADSFDVEDAVIAVASASSLEGPWTEQGTVLSPGGNTEWDEYGVFTPEAIVDGSTIYLFYSGEDVSSNTRKIGVATSSTSNPTSTFTKDGSNPIISPGAASSWEETLVDNAWPIQLSDGTWRLYYKGVNSSNAKKIGFATASDANFPNTWSKYGSNPVFGGGTNGSPAGSWEDPVVIIWEGAYHLLVTKTVNLPDQKVYYSHDGIDNWDNFTEYDFVGITSSEVSSWADAQTGGYVFSLLSSNPSYTMMLGQKTGEKVKIGLINHSVTTK